MVIENQQIPLILHIKNKISGRSAEQVNSRNTTTSTETKQPNKKIISNFFTCDIRSEFLNFLAELLAINLLTKSDTKEKISTDSLS